MVGHISVNHHAEFAVPLILAGIIDGVVETHGAGESARFQSPEVLGGGNRIHRKRQYGSVGRHHKFVVLFLLERQGRHSKGPVLVNLIGIERAVGGFGDAPGYSLFLTVFDLQFDGLAARPVEQRIAECPRKQQRHQIFEHRAGPREQRILTRGIHVRAAQGGPVEDRNVAFSDGHQARQTALAGEEIVVAGEFARTTHQVADSE